MGAALGEGLADDPLGPHGHLGRGPAGEGQEQDPTRVDSLEHEVGHAVRERVGLAGARAGDDQQGPATGQSLAADLGGGALARVQGGQLGQRGVG